MRIFPLKKIITLIGLSVFFLFSSSAIAKLVYIKNTGELEEALGAHHDVKGYIDLQKCTSIKGEKPLPAFVGYVSINFSQHIFTSKATGSPIGSIQVDNSFEMVHEESASARKGCPSGQKCPNSGAPIKPATTAVKGVRTMKFKKFDENVHTHIMIYSFDGHQIIADHELNCPWDNFDLVYTLQNKF